MGRKCCVPNCLTKTNMPSHRIPYKKREVWLRKICRLDLLDLPQKDLHKYSVCYEHFSDEMVDANSTMRLLLPNAEPVLNIPPQEVIKTESTPCNSTDDVLSPLSTSSFNCKEVMEIDNNFTEAPNLTTPKTEIPDNSTLQEVPTTQHNLTLKDLIIAKLKNKIKYYKQRYYQSKRKIKRIQREKKSKIKGHLKKGKQWEDIIPELSDAQKIFFDIIKTKFDRQPQGRRYTKEHKVLAATMYKFCGMKAYKFFRCLFPSLPSIQLLSSEMTKLNIETGISPLVIKYLKN